MPQLMLIGLACVKLAGCRDIQQRHPIAGNIESALLTAPAGCAPPPPSSNNNKNSSSIMNTCTAPGDLQLYRLHSRTLHAGLAGQKAAHAYPCFMLLPPHPTPTNDACKSMAMTQRCCCDGLLALTTNVDLSSMAGSVCLTMTALQQLCRMLSSQQHAPGQHC